MQLAAPEAFDLSRESRVTLQGYGLDDKVTKDFGRRCLLARRPIERGTRFVQVWSGPQEPSITGIIMGAFLRSCHQWRRVLISQSQHFGDMKARGLLEDTLLIWTTEFGRTPFAQGGDGRDHNGELSSLGWQVQELSPAYHMERG